MEDLHLNGDELYVSIKFLVQNGLSRSTIHNGFQRYDKRKTRNWNRIVHPLNKKWIYVEYDSIPSKVKLNAKLLSKDNLIAKYLQPKTPLKTEEEISITSSQIAIKVAFSSKWRSYLAYYIDSCRDESQSIFLAKNHAVIVELLTMKKHGSKVKNLYLAYNNCDEDFKFKATDSKWFYKRLKDFETGNIYDLLVHGNIDEKGNATKLSELHMLLLKQLYKNPKKFSYQNIFKKVNIELIDKGLETISISTVQHYLSKPEVQNECKVFRNGKKWMDTNLLPHLTRRAPENIGDQWQIDSSRFQFPFINKEKKVSFLTIFVVMDIHSRKIVGYSSDISENKSMIIEGLEMAVKNCQYLPAEIVLDNGGSYSSKEFKEMEILTTINGVEWRRCKVGNPQDKGNVERFFNTFQTTVCKLHDGYVGEGIKSKRENETYSHEYVQEILKSKFIRNRIQLERLVDELIEEYNELRIGKRDAPNISYLKSNPINTVKVSTNKIVQMFWNKTKITIRKSMVNLTVNKINFSYSIWSEAFIYKLNGRKVYVHFYPADMSEVFLFDEDNHSFLCKLKKDHKVQLASVSQSEKDQLEIKKYGGRKKSAKQKIIDRNKRERDFLSERYGVELSEENSKEGKIIHLNEKNQPSKGIYFKKGTLKLVNDKK